MTRWTVTLAIAGLLATADVLDAAFLCARLGRDGSLGTSIKLRETCRQNEQALAAPALNPYEPLVVGLPIPTTSTTSTTLPLTGAQATCLGKVSGQLCFTTVCDDGGYCGDPGDGILACAWLSGGPVACVTDADCIGVVAPGTGEPFDHCIDSSATPAAPAGRYCRNVCAGDAP